MCGDAQCLEKQGHHDEDMDLEDISDVGRLRETEAAEGVQEARGPSSTSFIFRMAAAALMASCAKMSHEICIGWNRG